MDTRRDFLKKAGLFSGVGLYQGFFSSIDKAMAIGPAPDSSYLDAEHIVILTQENRSFDHTFGSLNGARGFADPRAINLPNGNPVWLQSNDIGGFIPFRLDINNSKSTWMGSLPHSWTNQVDARNNGKHDHWLQSKKSSNKEYSHIPLTMGFYDRSDIPFYYSLADAFTICDQYFCSSLAGTTPNRLYLMTGTIRENHNPANVLNSDVDSEHEANWKTFPERLEDAGISWSIYQNELSHPSKLQGEDKRWLSNFTDNPLEWFSQYNVRAAFDEDLFSNLSPYEKSIHSKAFCTNKNDPNYHQMINLDEHIRAPKGDILHQFRSDVQNKKLSVVSWLVAPEKFSDHPTSPWYGAWYISQVLDILTKNEEVWKKTIFIINYDENDGYFDHIPPFVPPHPTLPNTGLVSSGIDIEAEYVQLHEEEGRRPPHMVRESPIGLGYRVPAIIASPWTRGGAVCSEVFDHTSVLQFIEKFLTHKTGKQFQEPNITSWRRTVCGDLTSVFQPTKKTQSPSIPFPTLEDFLKKIEHAKQKEIPKDYKTYTSSEMEDIRNGNLHLNLPSQEKGLKIACPLPYQFVVNGQLDKDLRQFKIRFDAKNSGGAPFIVYDSDHKIRNYAVSKGDFLEDHWDIDDQSYFLKVYGPNGFFREFRGSLEDPQINVTLNYQKSFIGKNNGNIVIQIENFNETKSYSLEIKHMSYSKKVITLTMMPLETKFLVVDTDTSFHWYDLKLRIDENERFEQRFSGKVETEEWGYCDPILAL